MRVIVATLMVMALLLGVLIGMLIGVWVIPPPVPTPTQAATTFCRSVPNAVPWPAGFQRDLRDLAWDLRAGHTQYLSAAWESKVLACTLQRRGYVR